MGSEVPFPTSSADNDACAPPAAKKPCMFPTPKAAPVFDPKSMKNVLWDVDDDGLISTTSTVKAPMRRNIRGTGTDAALVEAQIRELEELEAREKRIDASELAKSYMPIAVSNDVIDLCDSDDEVRTIDDDMPEFLGVVPAKNEYRRVPPPPVSNYKPSSSTTTYTAATDASTLSIRQAREEEEKRLHRSKRDAAKLESIELTPQGRLLVNQGKPEEDPDVFVNDHLTNILKPYQLAGIRFMYDNVIESITNYNPDNGFGCVLAHSMGLGKTLQIVSFVDIFLRYVGARHVLIIVPVNVIQNWLAEFEKWLPIRRFHVFIVGDTLKTFEDRRNVILKWHREGGVLLMGYDMFRLLVNNKSNKATPPRTPESRKVLKRDGFAPSQEPGFLNGAEDARRALYRALVDPGPDLVVCDEGHKIKCLKTSISNTLNQIRTKRRIVLTGYPLQNNLVEYYCMVNFVRPNFLGSKKDFSAHYDRPIRNGSCVDSTPHDHKVAQLKVHLLSKLVKGFVQRRTPNLLKTMLPENREFVLVMRKTPVQHALYRAFVLYTRVEMYSRAVKFYNPLKAHSIGTKIWNHPDLLYDAIRKKQKEKAQANAIANTPKITNFFNGSQNNGISLGEAAERSRLLYNNQPDYFRIYGHPGMQTLTKPPPKPRQNAAFSMDDVDFDELDNESGEISYEWAEQHMATYSARRLENSNKLIAAFEIIRETTALGDKILLFSSSVMTLNLVEEMLTALPEDFPMFNAQGQPIKWKKNGTFCRFDGTTSGIDREKLINRFNSSPEVHLFLISTKAGSLGINLVAANRVIVFDACWNPCHDAQAVCRVYRHGQTKKTYVYRLVTHNSMERAIFYRQISKKGLQNRVVDELQLSANVTTSQLEDLLQYDEAQDVVVGPPPDTSDWTFGDEVLDAVAQRIAGRIAEKPFLHDSMMFATEDALSEEEKLEAEIMFEHNFATNNSRADAYAAADVSARSGINTGALTAEQIIARREMLACSNAMKGSLSDMQRSVDYSEIGLKWTQHQIQNGPVQTSVQSYAPMPRPLYHPMQMMNGMPPPGSGALYSMNNTPVVRNMRPDSFSIRLIQDDIALPTRDGNRIMLLRGTEVRVMCMSNRTWLQPTAAGSQIVDGTGTIYDPRGGQPEIIQLD
uniref:Helicase ARIP4 n=1 Tax=Panagrellus redivivus TaxID=6233 RepID=A0A7E4VNB7_PANRE